MLSIGQAFDSAHASQQAHQIYTYLAQILDQQLAYFHTLSPSRQRTMPYTLTPRQETRQFLRTLGY